VLGDVQRVPVETLVLVAVPVVQQGLPGPPQLPLLQLPLLQVPGIGMQLLPFATQMLETQQPASLQVLPEQHICPGPPHAELVVTVPPVPEPPLPEPLVPALPPVPGLLVLPPEPLPPPVEGSPPEPPSPVSGKPPFELELEPLQPTARPSNDAKATAEDHWMDDARL